MQNGQDRPGRTVPEIFEGVGVPEAGRIDDRCPRATLLLRDQIARTFDRLVRVGPDLGNDPGRLT